MNYEDCVKATIKEATIHALRRLPELEPEERYCLMMEICEWATAKIDLEDELMVPQFQEEK